MSAHSVFVLITPVLHKGIKYSKNDKPQIAVPFDKTRDLLAKYFSQTRIFHHDYFHQNGDSVTFLVQK